MKTKMRPSTAWSLAVLRLMSGHHARVLSNHSTPSRITYNLAPWQRAQSRGQFADL
jgi:hypothetical protein